ncbi:hypothetical protein AYI71_00580 [Limosilactobacillus oris]|nr:hypothetical protein AYI71_00580 [Limosilactobacillus oris]
MKGLYRADAVNRTFVSSDVVADDYQLKDNETFEDPSGKLSPAKLTATGGPWIDATEEEHQAYMDAMQQDYLRQHPEASQPAEPDKGDQALNLLGQQQAKSQATVATLEKKVDTLTQAVGILGQQIAQAQKPATPQA